MWMTTGSLIVRRSEHTATLLPNGQVLVAGGLYSGNPVAKAELYDPATASWTRTGKLFHGRWATGRRWSGAATCLCQEELTPCHAAVLLALNSTNRCQKCSTL